MQKHRQARENSNLRVPFARGVVFYRFICKLNIMSILRLLFFSHFLLGFFWQETIYCVGVVLVRLASVFAYVCFLYFFCFFWKMQSEQEVFTFFRTSVDHWEFFFMNHVFICCVVYRGLWSDKQAARGWSGTTSASKANAKMWPCWIKWSNYNH